ncbi:MAG: hypothetical protein JNL17_13380 [Cyclobacteriaceae bacterium]|nr:hypothetical protein [Cyclobacteriaceae bacterium]
MRISASERQTTRPVKDQPSWENFTAKWNGKAQVPATDPGSLDIKQSLGIAHWLAKGLFMSRAITGVVDIPSMRYLYSSGHVKEMVGWDDALFWEHGVKFTYGKFHPDDLFALHEFSTLIGHYYKNLPEEERPAFTDYWDIRFAKPDGSYLRILEQGRVLKHDEAGNIIHLLIFVTDITHLKSENKNHLRLTNGKENVLYEYRMPGQKLIKLETPSEREVDVFRHISMGYTRKQIADRLGISLSTVKTHCQHVYEKLGTTDSVETLNLLKIWSML